MLVYSVVAQNDRFWISTGGITEPYETVTVVFGYGDAGTANGNEKSPGAMQLAIDDMAIKAQHAGCNGLIWIRFERVEETPMRIKVWAAGTAVKVKA